MKQAIAVVAAVVLVTVGAIVLLADDDGGGSGSPGDRPFEFSTTTTLTEEQQAAKEEGQAWQAGVVEDLAALSQLAGQYVTDAQSWQDGTLPTDQFRTELGEWKLDVTTSRIAIEGREAFEPAPEALPQYIALAALYDASITTQQAALDMPEGPLRDQAVLLAKRLRILGDRAFERAAAALDTVLLEAPDAVVADPVPTFAADDLAAGPPLDDTPPPAEPPTTVPDPVADRPSQPRADWLAALAAAGAPAPEEVFAALQAQDGDALADLARRFDAASEALRDEPDPDTDGGHEESARVRLAMLSQADLARLGRLAVLANDESLRFIAGDVTGKIVGPSFFPVP